MARFDFKSPGAAFTNQITEALAERKAEERQALLDQLTVNADVRAQESALRDAEREKRDAAMQDFQMDNMRFNRNLQELNLLTQNMRRGDNPMTRGVNPELTQFGRQYGMFEQPVDSPDLRYVGTSAERDRDEQVAGSKAAIEALLADPNRRSIGEALQSTADFNRGVVLPEVASRYLQPDVPLRVFDQDTGQLTSMGTVPGNAQVITRTRPPREYRPRNMMVLEDANGEAVLIDQESLPVDPATGTAKLPTGFRVPNRSRSSSADSPMGALNIPPAFLDNVTAVIDAMGVDPRSVDASQLSAARNALTTAFNAAKINVSRKSRQLASELLDKGANEHRAYIESVRGAGLYSPEDIAGALQLYGSVPAQARDMLSANPYVKPTEKQSWREYFFGK